MPVTDIGIAARNQVLVSLCSQAMTALMDSNLCSHRANLYLRETQVLRKQAKTQKDFALCEELEAYARQLRVAARKGFTPAEMVGAIVANLAIVIKLVAPPSEWAEAQQAIQRELQGLLLS